jgi:uncharacterized membrane protein
MIAKTENNYKWFALSCTTLDALLSALDGSILIIALASIARDLHKECCADSLAYQNK